MHVANDQGNHPEGLRRVTHITNTLEEETLEEEAPPPSLQPKTLLLSLPPAAAFLEDPPGIS